VSIIAFDLNLLLFLTWGFTDSYFPWWVFPCAVSVALCIWLYMRHKKQEDSFEKLNVDGEQRSNNGVISKNKDMENLTTKGSQAEDAIPL
jgi:hypothetical protein